MNKALIFTYSSKRDKNNVYHIYPKRKTVLVQSLCKKATDRKTVTKKPIDDNLCMDCYGTQINLEELHEKKIIQHEKDVNVDTKREEVFISSRHDNIVQQLTDPLVELRDKQHVEQAEEKHRNNEYISAVEVIDRQKKADNDLSIKTTKRQELIKKNKAKVEARKLAVNRAKVHQTAKIAKAKTAQAAQAVQEAKASQATQTKTNQAKSNLPQGKITNVKFKVIDLHNYFIEKCIF